MILPVRREFSGGLTAVAAPTSAAPVFTAMLVVEAGSRYDPEGRSGLASMVGRLLLEGTLDSSAEEVALAVDSLGSSLDVVTDYETTALVVTGLVEHYRESLELLSSVISRPLFDAGAFEEAVRRHLAELADDEGQAYQRCRREFMRTVFGSHPRANPVDGLTETVRGLRAEDVTAFYGRCFGPSRAILGVAGELDVEGALDTAAEVLEGWSGGGEAAAPSPPVRQGERRTRFIEADSSQVHMCMGNLAIARSDPLFYATSVMDVILGDSAGFGSRLATRLREERGLAYVIESDTSGTAGLEPGLFWTYTATSPERLEPLFRGVIEELRAVGSAPPSPEEVDYAVSFLRGRDLVDRETSEARAGHLIHSERYGLGLDFELRYGSLVAAVTPDDVLEAARHVIDTECFSLVAVGPSGTDDPASFMV